MKVVFAGGGTGGHVYPAIAIADALRDRGASIDFTGTAGRLEATLVPRAGYRLHTIAAGPLARVLSFGLLKTLAANAAGTAQSLRLLRGLRPDLVVATGGYVCFPVALAARALRAIGMLRAPIALLEPNATPGLTNRVLAPLVDEIWGAFPQPASGSKYQTTGIPVRASLRVLPARDAAIERLGLHGDARTLVALGGSQGARSINDALMRLVDERALPEGWQLLHVTGESDYSRVAERYAASARGRSGRVLAFARPYLDAMADAYAAADLVLARAGASTLGELKAVEKPAILVPYPHATGDHQTANAQAFAQTGAATILSDRELQDGRLPQLLAAVTAPERLAAMTTAAQATDRTDPLAMILARVDALAARKRPQ